MTKDGKREPRCHYCGGDLAVEVCDKCKRPFCLDCGLPPYPQGTFCHACTRYPNEKGYV